MNQIIGKRISSDVILGVGDDAAAIKTNPECTQLVSSDSQVEGTHFNLDWIEPVSLGKRAISVSFSDIAAMGGTAKYSVVSLVLPNNLTLEFFQKLFSGIRQQTEYFDSQVIGGNISSGSDKLIIDITILGEVKRELLVSRSNAKVGDHIYVTGMLGNGVAGLELLRYHGLKYPSKYKNIVDSYLNPTARMKVGGNIARSKYATSMIDLSDGLSSDLGHICTNSKVGAEISYDLLPKDRLLNEIHSKSPEELKRIILHGGDCYELLFTVNPDVPIDLIKSISKESGVKLTRIGYVTPKERGIILIDAKKNRETLKPLGWNHFSE